MPDLDKPSLTSQAMAAADKLGLPRDLAVDIILDDKLTPEFDSDTVTSALARGAEIYGLCQIDGCLKDHAKGAIQSGLPMAEVRIRLMNIRADADEAIHTDGHPPSHSSLTFDIYQARKAQK